jgi:hypothetical protein
MTDNREAPKHGASLAEQLAGRGGVLEGLQTELEERTRTPFARTGQSQPAREEVNAEPKARTFSDGRPRRLAASTEAAPEKNVARSMLVVATDGEDVVCEHDHRVGMRCNKPKTRMFLVFGMDLILVWGRRLDILRDSIEAHRIDLLQVATNPEIDASYPGREHISRVEIRFLRPTEFDQNGEFKAVAEDNL